MEVKNETFYPRGRLRFLTCRVTAIAPRCARLGCHGGRHPHSILGECHRLRSRGHARNHGLARNPHMNAFPSSRRCSVAPPCGTFIGLGPNPSLNRTPAGELAPARRSPVSLLRQASEMHPMTHFTNLPKLLLTL